MKITLTTTKTETATHDIEVPYYSRNFNSYFRIDEDETVIQAYSMGGFSYISAAGKGINSHYMEGALSGQPISREEFEEAARAAIDKVNQSLNLQPAEL